MLHHTTSTFPEWKRGGVRLQIAAFSKLRLQDCKALQSPQIGGFRSGIRVYIRCFFSENLLNNFWWQIAAFSGPDCRFFFGGQIADCSFFKTPDCKIARLRVGVRLQIAAFFGTVSGARLQIAANLGFRLHNCEQFGPIADCSQFRGQIADCSLFGGQIADCRTPWGPSVSASSSRA